MKSQPTIHRAGLLSRLRTLTAKRETPAPGYHTAQDWAKKWGLSITAANRLIVAGSKQGLIKSKRFRIPLRDGRIYPLTHYAER